MLARRGVGPRCPKQRLVERPRSNHDNSYVRGLCRCNGSAELRLVIGPKLATFSIVDLHGGVGEELGEALEGGYAVERGVEEDVVSELSQPKVSPIKFR